jgi:hypothetical protein
MIIIPASQHQQEQLVAAHKNKQSQAIFQRTFETSLRPPSSISIELDIIYLLL